MHVIVATAPKSDNIDIQLENDIQTLRPALLYADQVTLISPIASILRQTRKETSNFEEVVPLLKPILEQRGQGDLYNEVNRLAKKKRGKSKQEILVLEQMKKLVRSLDSQFDSQFGTNAGILEALERDKSIKIEHVPFSLVDSIESALGNPTSEKHSNVAQDYIEIVINSILQCDGYPLFDTFANELFEGLTAIWNNMGLETSAIPESKCTHIGVAAHILRKLPNINNVHIEDLLAIKQELHNPLVRFRGGVEGFSNDIEKLPWDNSFESEAEHIFITQIEPAVAEIEELCKETKWIRNILLNSNNLIRNTAYGIGGGGGFANVLIGTPDFRFVIIGALLGLAHSIEAGFRQTLKDHIQSQKEAKGKQMYFLYECGRQLNKG